MSRNIWLRFALPLIVAAAFLPVSAPAQSQQDSQTQSVAEAARRAREQKKSATKPSKLITDDNLKPAEPAPSAAAEPAPAPRPSTDSSASQDATQPAPPPAAEDADAKAKDASELAGLKQQLAEAQKALDFLQRDLALQQDTYYSNPNHANDPAGQAKLDAMSQQIADKAQEVAALKARVADLQAKVGTPPPAPQNPPQP